MCNPRHFNLEKLAREIFYFNLTNILHVSSPFFFLLLLFFWRERGKKLFFFQTFCRLRHERAEIIAERLKKHFERKKAGEKEKVILGHRLNEGPQMVGEEVAEGRSAITIEENSASKKFSLRNSSFVSTKLLQNY